MSEEMLERAKEWLGNIKEIANEQTDIDKMEHMKERIEVQDWLIKQAEQNKRYRDRIEELEAKNWKYIEQNKRYREALGFYANKINHLTFIENGRSNIEHDQGETARKALEGEE